MTVFAVLASLVPILWETGIGSDVMKPIAAPIVGGMITSTIHVLILVPVFFAADEGAGASTWHVAAGTGGVIKRGTNRGVSYMAFPSDPLPNMQQCQMRNSRSTYS